MANIGTYPCHCKRCGNNWLAHRPNPSACSKCHQGLWNSDKGYREETLEDKFWMRVEKSDGCWLWAGWIMRNGYGNLRYKKGAYGVQAHRLSWAIHFGDIPDGLCVLHKCDVRACVRPDHLFLGTRGDNNKDCVRKGRNQRGEKHGNAILNWEKVNAMRRLYASGQYTLLEMGDMFGVTKGNAHCVIARKTWNGSCEASDFSLP